MPRMLDLIRASAVPATLVQAAAKGALSVPPAEMIEILVHLAVHNKVFGAQARMTLAGWDEKASKNAASDPSTSKEVLDYLVAADNLRPVLLPVLLENPSISDEALLALATVGSREVVEAMLQSTRSQKSPEILRALKANPNLNANEVPAEAGNPAEEILASAEETEAVEDD